MPRRILLLLAAAFLFVLPQAIHAQSYYPNDEFVWQDLRAPYYPPEPAWGPDMRPTARFPLTVRLFQFYRNYDGVSFAGGGTVHLFDQQAQDTNFAYRCGVTFTAYRPREFYARWIKADRKLEILLRKPGTDETRTCRISLRPR